MKKILLIILGLNIVLLADFTRDSNDIIVSDNVSGLEWQDDNLEPPSLNWVDAIAYCTNLDLGGYSDWRLPNINEITSLVDDSKVDPAIYSIFRQRGYFYWSSTTYVKSKNYAWFIRFFDGSHNSNPKRTEHHVRCVRAGK